MEIGVGVELWFLPVGRMAGLDAAGKVRPLAAPPAIALLLIRS